MIKKTEWFLSILMIFSLTLVSIILFKKAWPITEGDPSIAWVFSKNLSEFGAFLEYNLGEKSTAATSVGHFLLLSLVHKFFGAGPEYLYFDLTTFILYITSIFVLFILFLRLKTSPLIASLGCLFYFLYLKLIHYSAVSYETPGWFLFLFLTLLTSIPFLKKYTDKLDYKNYIYFIVSSSLFLIYRPESILFFLFIFASIVLKNIPVIFKKNIFTRLFLLFTLSISSYLIVLYFNFITTGTMHGSSSLARLSLTESQSLNIKNPLLMSIFDSLNYVWILIIPAFLSTIFAYKNIKESNRYLLILNLGFLYWFLFILFNFKYGVDIQHRYTVPFIGLACILTPITLELIFKSLNRNLLKILSIIFLISFLLVKNKNLINERVNFYTNYSLMTPPESMFETKLVDWLHNNTSPEAKILAYEVQIKYLLNRYIIDLDGIISGKSLKYFKSNNWDKFLCTYRPDYWIANDAINYRKDMFLKNNIFSNAIINLKIVDDVYIENGIEFKLVKLRPKPDTSYYAEYTHVIKLKYLKCE